MKEFNKQIRRELKYRAKSAMSGQIGRIMGLQYISLILILLPIALIYGIVLMPSLLKLGFTGDPAVQTMDLLFELLGKAALTLALEVVFILLASAVLTLGTMYFFDEMAQGKQVKVSYLFYIFRRPELLWPSIKMSICLAFRGFLWTIVPNIIYGAVYTKTIFTVGRVPSFSVYIAYYMLIYLITIKVQTYSAGWLLLLRDGKIGAWEASKRGTRMFKGHMFDLLVLDLSFLPWYLLAGFILAPMLVSFGMAIMTGSIALVIGISVLFIVIWMTLVIYISTYQWLSFLNMCYYLGEGTESLLSRKEEQGDKENPEDAFL